MEELYRVQAHPVCDKRAVVQGEKYRISILTPWLFRLEYNEEGHFEDRATQCVWNRCFPVPEFQVFEKEDSLEILTEGIQMRYDKKRFSANGLSLQVRGNLSAYSSIWHYGEEASDLLGTARTLDMANGAVKLEHGVISRNGFAVMDDSGSLLLREDGWVEPRQGENIDLYFFGYGHQYEKCLKDFYRLTGNTPLLPRYTLGNWWSRYHRYSEEEYKELILRFEREQIPFSVSVIDMDWHLVDIDPKYGSGWTGYTWNKELFPDPAEFMEWLHSHNLKVTLNVHPAEGVRPHEEAYKEMAQELQKDWEHEEFIPFDITDEKFLRAYFKYLHHPNEEDGVDFWWVDWQQGSASKIPGWIRCGCSTIITIWTAGAAAAGALHFRGTQGWEAIGIRSDFPGIRSSPGSPWISSRILPQTRATRDTAGGATISEDICRDIRTTNCPRAGFSSAYSHRSCACTARTARLQGRNRGITI